MKKLNKSKKYFEANIDEQNETWKHMYKQSLKDFSIFKDKELCAEAYVKCYNLLTSGDADIEIEDICPADVNTIVYDFFLFRNELNNFKDKIDDRLLCAVGYKIYDDMFSDAETTYKYYCEYA